MTGALLTAYFGRFCLVTDLPPEIKSLYFFAFRSPRPFFREEVSMRLIQEASNKQSETTKKNLGKLVEKQLTENSLAENSSQEQKIIRQI